MTAGWQLMQLENAFISSLQGTNLKTAGKQLRQINRFLFIFYFLGNEE